MGEKADNVVQAIDIQQVLCVGLAKNPDAIALIDYRKRYTWYDLEKKSSALAKSLLARSVFDIPLECLPNGNPAPPYVAVGGNTPSNTKGKDVIQWEWPGGVPGLSKRRQQFCDHAVAVLGTP